MSESVALCPSLAAALKRVDCNLASELFVVCTQKSLFDFDCCRQIPVKEFKTPSSVGVSEGGAVDISVCG